MSCAHVQRAGTDQRESVRAKVSQRFVSPTLWHVFLGIMRIDFLETQCKEILFLCAHRVVQSHGIEG